MTSKTDTRLRVVNLWSSRIIPVLELGAVIFSVYLVTYHICIRILIKAADIDNVLPKLGAAITILTIEYVLLLLLLLTWGRLMFTHVNDYGNVPKGRPPIEQKNRTISNSTNSTTKKSELNNLILNRQEVRDGLIECPPGMEQFYFKEVFICGMDGLPLFCDACWNWKPDRAHHSSELNRCVRRYDHYCPWVGGAISEVNNKFFIQFGFYASLYCVFTTTVCAWTLQQYHRSNDGQIIAGIIISTVFLVMAAAVFLKFGHQVIVNETTIEQFQKHIPRYYIAVRIEKSELHRPAPSSSSSQPKAPYYVMTYPLPNPSKFQPARSSDVSRLQHTPSQGYMYALLPPIKRSNIWNLGGLENVKSIMGDRIWDWFLPLRMSPCLRHDSEKSHFDLGKEFEDLERTYLPQRYDTNNERKKSW